MSIYAKFEGIPGVGNPGTYDGWHKLDTINWGMNHMQHGSGSGAAALRVGRVQIADINFTKTSDKQSPLFIQNCTMGKHITKVEIHLTGGTQDELKYGTFLLEKVIISSYQISGHENDHPTESMAMSFGKYTVKFATVDADTGKYDAGAEFTYDVTHQKV